MTDTAPTQVPAQKKSRRPLILTIVGVLTAVALLGALIYIRYESQFVYTDKATVSAPLIKLTPLIPGPLKKVWVNQGDWLTANETVARVGDELVQTQVPGLAVIVKQDLGANYAPNDPVVTMIEPKELRVIAQIQEDKGLKDIYIGQKATFTVDAFGSRKYQGEVEAISETSREGDVVFNISDKRETNQFDVKIKYDVTAYPELQNGMSAKVWIVK